MCKRSYIIGISNNNAPTQCRKYQCPDHIFYYKLIKEKKNSMHSQIILATEKFDALVYSKIRIKFGKKHISSNEIEEYQRIINPEKHLKQMLLQDRSAKPLEIILNDDEKQLYLCRSYIIELNHNISKLINITVLQTCCNYLYDLPYGIGCLKNLKMLIVSRNRLSELPEEIGFCKELREIDASYNQITKIPRSIMALKKLNTLHLVSNKIKKIPAFLGKLKSLKFIGIGKNYAQVLPLEIFKLPFLLNISFDLLNQTKLEKKFEKVGNLTLIEIAARNIIKNNLMIPKNLPNLLKKYLLNCQECSFCGGAFFESYIEVNDYHILDSKNFPITYRMCLKHYQTHEERVPRLFEQNIQTVPDKLIREKMPTVSELFEPFTFNEFQIKTMEEGFYSKNDTMPLISLAIDNLYLNKKSDIKNLLNKNLESC